MEEKKKEEMESTEAVSEEQSSEEMDMGTLLAQMESEAEGAGASDNSLLMARVISITDDGALVDIGQKSEALIPKKEFGKNPPFAVGDSVPVLFLSQRKEKDYLQVSWKAAREKMAWEHIVQAHQRKLPVQAKVKGETKGGLLAECEGGLIGFVPASQIDLRPSGNLKKWKGVPITAHILEYDIRKNNLVLSRKLWLTEEIQKKKSETLSNLKVGDIRKGIVTGITTFGAFVDIGGIEGLLHIGEIEWSHTYKVSDVLKIGQEIEVQVKSFDPKSERVSLSRKALLPHPWDGIEEKFPVGSIVEGKVVSITDFGAFVELAPHVEGLLHSSEISWNSYSGNPQDLLKVGEPIRVKILSVNRAEEKISLSLKRTQESPWEKIAKNYPVGTKVKVKVSYLVPFGAFVRLPEGIEGLVHISDFSWTRRVRHPEDILKVGDEIEVKVIEVNPETEKISFGIKQLKDNPYEVYTKGKKVSGKVKEVNDAGAVLEIEADLEGFVPRSEISQDKTKHPVELLTIGEMQEAKVIQVDPKNRKIVLSIKQLEAELQRAAQKKYSGNQPQPSLGKLLES